MPAPVVLYDACVLYPAPLRSFLMYLAVLDLFRARWSAAIHEEWIANVLKNRPDISRPQLERVRSLMDANIRDCLVTGYEDLVSELTLPDSGDRHVLAAAIHCQADVILTFNLKDFPAAVLAPYGIVAQHPDDFLVDLFQREPIAVCAAARNQRRSMKNPPMDVMQYLSALERQRLTRTVELLRTASDSL